MKIKLKIQQKIQVFIISASIIIYIVAIGYISLSNRNMVYQNITDITNKTVQNYATDIANKLNVDCPV